MSRTYHHVALTADDLRALAQHYDGLRFTQARVDWIETDDPRDAARDERVAINVAGPAEALLRHGFIRRSWTSLPPCGVRIHRTKGFGNGTVKRRRGGGLLVHGTTRTRTCSTRSPPCSSLRCSSGSCAARSATSTRHGIARSSC